MFEVVECVVLIEFGDFGVFVVGYVDCLLYLIGLWYYLMWW